MALAVKGSTLLFLRDKVKQRGSEFEKEFVRKLTAEERNTYESALAFTWVPLTVMAGLHEKGAQTFCPGVHSSSLHTWGKMSMLYDLGGIYKMAMKFTAIPFAVKQAARVWATFHNGGQAHCEDSGKKGEVAFVLRGCEDLPEVFTHTLAGSIEAVVDTAGGKNTRVRYVGATAGEHRWEVTWS